MATKIARPEIRKITPPMTAIRIFCTSSSSMHFIHFMPTVATKMAISPSRMPITIKARVACKVLFRFSKESKTLHWICPVLCDTQDIHSPS